MTREGRPSFIKCSCSLNPEGQCRSRCTSQLPKIGNVCPESWKRPPGWTMEGDCSNDKKFYKFCLVSRVNRSPDGSVVDPVKGVASIRCSEMHIHPRPPRLATPALVTPAPATPAPVTPAPSLEVDDDPPTDQTTDDTCNQLHCLTIYFTYFTTELRELHQDLLWLRPSIPSVPTSSDSFVNAWTVSSHRSIIKRPFVSNQRQYEHDS